MKKIKGVSAQKTKDLRHTMHKVSIHVVESYCESPIERKTAWAIKAIGMKNNLFLEFMSPKNFQETFLDNSEGLTQEGGRRLYGSTDMIVVPNMPVRGKEKNYRVDFLISHKVQGKKKRQITMIECDSFQFHSTASQLEADKKRERDLRSKYPDWKMLRFSGKEIKHDIYAVATEIVSECLGKRYG